MFKHIRHIYQLLLHVASLGHLLYNQMYIKFSDMTSQCKIQ